MSRDQEQTQGFRRIFVLGFDQIEDIHTLLANKHEIDCIQGGKALPVGAKCQQLCIYVKSLMCDPLIVNTQQSK